MLAYRQSASAPTTKPHQLDAERHLHERVERKAHEELVERERLARLGGHADHIGEDADVRDDGRLDDGREAGAAEDVTGGFALGEPRVAISRED